MPQHSDLAKSGIATPYLDEPGIASDLPYKGLMEHFQAPDDVLECRGLVRGAPCLDVSSADASPVYQASSYHLIKASTEGPHLDEAGVASDAPYKGLVRHLEAIDDALECRGPVR